MKPKKLCLNDSWVMGGAAGISPNLVFKNSAAYIKAWYEYLPAQDSLVSGREVHRRIGARTAMPGVPTPSCVQKGRVAADSATASHDPWQSNERTASLYASHST